jgi:tRNA threonylcarbamoyladenosine modification (KEOPS) complex  Pcc1 subunit
MQQKIFAELRFCFESEKKAENALLVILPDLKSRQEKRSQTVAETKKNCLVFSINADDLQALKTSMNSCTKSVGLINDLIGGFS